jgi:beta-glucanase (GH16 family)
MEHKKLVFEELFSGDELNRKTWNVEVGEKWYNAEAQCYVDDKEHIIVNNGLLLKAKSHPEKTVCRYQSARLNTRGKYEWQYGTFVVRAKVGQGIGSWPAIWFLPTDIGPVKWPRCGEIDLMEVVGRDPEVMHFSLHTEWFNHMIKTQRTKFLKIPYIHEDFHDFKMVWTPQSISFFVDDQPMVTFEKTEPNVPLESWPFDKPYYLILNIAVGGTWGGHIDEKAMPYTMEIASVRVYQ